MSVRFHNRARERSSVQSLPEWYTNQWFWIPERRKLIGNVNFGATSIPATIVSHHHRRIASSQIESSDARRCFKTPGAAAPWGYTPAWLHRGSCPPPSSTRPTWLCPWGRTNPAWRCQPSPRWPPCTRSTGWANLRPMASPSAPWRQWPPCQNPPANPYLAAVQICALQHRRTEASLRVRVETLKQKQSALLEAGRTHKKAGLPRAEDFWTFGRYAVEP